MTESHEATVTLADEAGTILQMNVSEEQLLVLKGYISGLKQEPLRLTGKDHDHKQTEGK